MYGIVLAAYLATFHAADDETSETDTGWLATVIAVFGRVFRLRSLRVRGQCWR